VAVALGVLGVCGACGDSSASPETGSSEGSGSSTATTAIDSTAAASSSSSSGTTSAEVDELPPTPTLLSPVDGALEIPLETELCWNLVDDPEGEPLRYRVFVDDIELSMGLLGEEGHEGPCVGPLTFAFERSYAWQVQAIEVDDPSRGSERSEAFTFTTIYDGISTTVFEDDFDEDLGWELSGDAQTGAWVRGNPVPATYMGALSQPSSCGGGESCYFTGQNLGGQADDEDVSGGSAVLTSPPFNLSQAAAATVQLSRFFFKSELARGPSLRVDLLVPGPGRGEFEIYPLEQLELSTNLWTPLEYAVCGVPMVEGSRLRITATDMGAEILEAAIDSVSVHAHDFATVCATAEGGSCDPAVGEGACPGELLCCSQGAINRGIYRCSTPVASLDWDSPPATPESPNNGPLGCDAADIFIDESWIEPVFTDIFVSEATCEYGEGCLGGLGWRTIMRFALTTPNIGSSDLVLGVAANEPDVFHFSECHGHYHFDEYARYELFDAGGISVASGHKQAFCLLDTFSWAWNNEPGVYDCSNQGIGRGYADIYEADLPCQWIDVSDVPPGEYMLRATLNSPRPESALPLLNERRYDNNMVEVPVTVR